jgi:hypothetical protein
VFELLSKTWGQFCKEFSNSSFIFFSVHLVIITIFRFGTNSLSRLSKQVYNSMHLVTSIIFLKAHSKKRGTSNKIIQRLRNSMCRVLKCKAFECTNKDRLTGSTNSRRVMSSSLPLIIGNSYPPSDATFLKNRYILFILLSCLSAWQNQ